jgi:hypothetical protein
MSGKTWTLDLESEHQFLLPFLDSEPDESARVHVLEYLADIVRDPVRPRLEDPKGVYSVTVPGTDVVFIWALDWNERVIVLVNPPTHIGPSR